MVCSFDKNNVLDKGNLSKSCEDFMAMNSGKIK